jgi:hypothetical protein
MERLLYHALYFELVSFDVFSGWEMKKPMIGIEPITAGLQNQCSTVELHWHLAAGNGNKIGCFSQ